MLKSASELNREESAAIYPTLLTPRPIVLIGTCKSGSECVNLAPFSSMAFVSNFPPMVTFSVGQRRGEPKDTLVNILETGEFVVNMIGCADAEKVVLIAATPTEDVDDYERGGFERADFGDYKAGRLAGAPAAFGCKLITVHDLAPSVSKLVVAEVKLVYLNDELIDNGGLDPINSELFASIGAEAYVSLRGLDRFHHPRTWD